MLNFVAPTGHSIAQLIPPAETLSEFAGLIPLDPFNFNISANSLKLWVGLELTVTLGVAVAVGEILVVMVGVTLGVAVMIGVGVLLGPDG